MGGDGGPTSRRQSNKGCRLCCEVAAKVIHEMTWWHNKWPLPLATQVRDDLPCAGGDCFQKDGNKGLYFAVRTVGFAVKLFCSERQLE